MRLALALGVAGRMARFSGVVQGLAVRAWALLAAIVGAVVSVVAGRSASVLGSFDAFPRLPVPTTHCRSSPSPSPSPASWRSS
ncbi:hypothetical protein ACFWGP_18010 [Agromyces sp. NPDC127015]|uniref:hypothetical protein n=1 Tax=Agromyces sp. NPDC127015 TaxID=3347108 RepID=UPI00365C25E9